MCKARAARAVSPAGAAALTPAVLAQRAALRCVKVESSLTLPALLGVLGTSAPGHFATPAAGGVEPSHGHSSRKWAGGTVATRRQGRRRPPHDRAGAKRRRRQQRWLRRDGSCGSADAAF